MTRSWLAPLDCVEVGGLLAGYTAGNLDPESDGRVRGHLENCDYCASAFSRIVGADIVAGKLPIQGGLTVSPTVMRQVKGRSLLIWGKDLVHQAALMAMGYSEAVELALSGGYALSDSPGETILFKLLNIEGYPIQGAEVPGSVISAPFLEQNGRFTMTVSIGDDAAALHMGSKAICLLKLDSEWLGFESTVRAPQVEFRSVGLPSIFPEDRILDTGVLEYVLMPQ